MDMVYNNGKMEQNMKENGKMEKQMVMEYFIILREIYIKDTGRMIKQMGMVFIHLIIK